MSIFLACLASVSYWSEHITWVHIPITARLVEGSDRLIEGSSIDLKPIEGSTYTSKDDILRGPSTSIEGLSFELIGGSKQSFDDSSFDTNMLQPCSNCLAKSNQEDGWLGQTYRTNKGHRFISDRIQTKYRHKCTNKLPLGCSFVSIFVSSNLWRPFKSSMSEDLQSLHVLKAESVSTNYPYHVGSVLTNSPLT